MTDVDTFDLVVLGAGPAGEKAAAQAAWFGKRVAVVERDRLLGGAMVGSVVATKTFREAAVYVTGFRRRDVYGVAPDLDAREAVERVLRRSGSVVATMHDAVGQNLRRHGIELVAGTARLGPDRTVQVATAEGGTRLLRAQAVLVATGSRPFHPPDIDFSDPDILDSEAARELDGPAPSVVVIGGGVIGCEYASMLRALGSEVVLVDSGPRLLPFVDNDISELLAASFVASGIEVARQTGRATVARVGHELEVRLPDGRVLRPAKVVVAAGRVGNTEDLGLADVGVATDERGRIVVDERYRTTAPGIYAAGDVVGPPALASVAMEQGRVAACDAFGIPFKQAVDSLAPYGVYTIPEVAMVGLTEQDARERWDDVEVGCASFDRNTRAVIAGTPEGAVKLVFRTRDLRLLGVHILGESASELVHYGQAVLHFGGGIDHFISATSNVPTMTEAYKYAAYDGLGRVAASAGRPTVARPVRD